LWKPPPDKHRKFRILMTVIANPWGCQKLSLIIRPFVFIYPFNDLALLLKNYQYRIGVRPRHELRIFHPAFLGGLFSGYPMTILSDFLYFALLIFNSLVMLPPCDNRFIVIYPMSSLLEAGLYSCLQYLKSPRITDKKVF